jgi:hypothetical protein
VGASGAASVGGARDGTGSEAALAISVLCGVMRLESDTDRKTAKKHSSSVITSA